MSDGFLGLLGAGGHWEVVGKGLDGVAPHSAYIARDGESSAEKAFLWNDTFPFGFIVCDVMNLIVNKTKAEHDQCSASLAKYSAHSTEVSQRPAYRRDTSTLGCGLGLAPPE